MKQRIKSLAYGTMLVVAAALTTVVTVTPAAAWEPTKPVEVIVPAGAGGASDQMARTMQGIIVKYKLMKQPIMILNKGGASGAEGAMDTKGSKGNAHKLMVAFSLIYTLPVSTNLPFTWHDLNPVAMVAMDEFLLWVNPSKSYKTVKEFLAAVKAAPAGTFKMGGTGSKREDHIITVAIDKFAGTKFTYIPYKSGGEVAVQLAGGHIDSNVNNPSENVAQWRGGQALPLCVFSDERMLSDKKITNGKSWADIPTCKEAGLDVQYQMLRAFFLPPGTTPEQVAFYADLLKKVVATQEWKDYTEKTSLKNKYLTGADFVKFLEKDEAFHNKLMLEAGFGAKK
ncbi:MAG: tripartite tricarboxylate transporter substrate binding protein [Syntrophales bacterium]|nr:tripartite tricarboxylate transporter substrate binding protein [Syntrophales bacterium]